MTRYIIVRTIWVFVILFTILSLNFTILKLAPEFPPTTEEARDIFYSKQVSDGYMTIELVTDPQDINDIRNNEYDLCDQCYAADRGGDVIRIYTPVPLAKQYANWVKNIVTRWDWGLSTRVQPNVPVFDLLKARIPTTMKLNMVALFFYIPIGFGLGIVAALWKDSWLDNLISFLVMIFISIPSFVVMTLLVMYLGFVWEVLPTQWPASDFTGSIVWKAYFIPVLGLSFGAIAGLTRFTRAELTEVLTSEFLLLARTKGLKRSQAVIRHAMRNSMVPLVPTIIFSFVGLLSGSVIVEQIYGIPGTGRLYIAALTPGSLDYNLLMASTGFYTTIGLFAVLLVDLSYGLVDPRIRMGARK
jgi:oligopeptide transport system permease protein